MFFNSQTFSYFLPIRYPASMLRVAFLSLRLSIRLLLDALRHLGKRCDHHDSPDFHPQTAAIIKLSPQQTPETKTAQFLIQACVCGPLAPQAATWSLALHLAQGASTSTSKSTSSTLHLAQGGRCYHCWHPEPSLRIHSTL